jgi:branched-chain amino acid transport system permease protein
VGTLGLVLVIQEVATMIWGPANRSTEPPEALAGLVDLGFASYPAYRLFVMAVAIVVGAVLWWLIERSRFGASLRAGAEDRDMAASLGINTGMLFALTFAIGVGLAALGGVLAAPTRGLNPGSAAEILGIAFVVIVVGGMGSFLGAFVGAVLIGVAQALTIAFAPAYGSVVIYLAMIVVLMVKSDGLFGKVSRVR